jgi:hypothetical protein
MCESACVGAWKRSKTGQRASHGAGHGAQVNKNLPLFLCLLIRN